MTRSRVAGRRGRPRTERPPRISDRRWGLISGASLAACGVLIAAVLSPVGDVVREHVKGLLGSDEVVARVTADALHSPCVQAYGVPKAEESVLPRDGTAQMRQLIDDPRALRRWVKAHDVAFLGDLSLDIFSATRSPEVLTLQDIRVTVVSKHPAGRMEPLAAACGGAGLFHWFHVPLDRLPVGRTVSVREIYQRWPQAAVPPPPDAREEPELAQQAEQLRQLRLPLEVSAGDPEDIRIVAEAEHCDCRWRAELVWVQPGKDPVKTVVDLDGRPFRTVGTLP
jgi:hypothetical protein